MIRMSPLGLAPTLLLAFALGACADDQDGEPDLQIESDATVDTLHEAPGTEAGSMSTTVRLQSVGDAASTGQAVLRPEGGDITVELDLRNLPETGSLHARLAAGTCAGASAEGEPATVQGEVAPDQAAATSGPGANQGQVIAEMDLGSGETDATTRWTLTPEQLEAQRWAYLSIVDADENPVACGDLPENPNAGSEPGG